VKGLATYRDYDGSFRVEGYPELPFSTEEDPESAAELALHYFIDRYSREISQERRYQKAAARGQAVSE
jgi:hypothetical protein